MIVNVRVSGVLAQKIGVPRFQVTLPSPAQAQDLVAQLRDTYPHLSAELARVIIVVGGVHQPETAVLEDEQEVALLMPIAGGCNKWKKVPRAGRFSMSRMSSKPKESS